MIYNDFSKVQVELLTKEANKEQLEIAKDAYKLCLTTHKLREKTPEGQDPEVCGLTFACAMEVIKTQQIIKKLDEIKHILEN